MSADDPKPSTLELLAMIFASVLVVALCVFCVYAAYVTTGPG